MAAHWAIVMSEWSTMVLSKRKDHQAGQSLDVETLMMVIQVKTEVLIRSLARSWHAMLDHHSIYISPGIEPCCSSKYVKSTTEVSNQQPV